MTTTQHSAEITESDVPTECEGCGDDRNVRRTGGGIGTYLCPACEREADRIDAESAYGTRWAE